jgi:hypothetical protein
MHRAPRVLISFTTHGGAVMHRVYRVSSGAYRVLTFCPEFGSRWMTQRDDHGRVREYPTLIAARDHMRAISTDEGDSLSYFL